MRQTQWYVVYTRPKFEQIVFENSKKKGFQSFFPTITTVRQWSDRKKKINLPLFPGYVFVKLHVREMYQILSIRGAIKFVCFGNEATIILEEEISRIKKLIDSPFEIEVTHIKKPLCKGEMLTLHEGPFAGKTVQFIDYKGKKRGVFHIESLEKTLIVNIPIDTLALEKS